MQAAHGRKYKSLTPEREVVDVSSPSLLVGIQILDGSGSSRALHLREATLREYEYGCDGFAHRALTTYTFAGSSLEWGDVPTTNDPDQPREGMNVGERPSIETAKATWVDN